MTCPNCNKELPDGMSLCTSCGTRISQPQQPAPPQIPIDITPPNDLRQPEAPETMPVKKKKSKALVITAIVTAIALVLGCGAGWWFLWGPGAKVTVYVLTEVRSYSGDVNYSTTTYEYDDHGRLLEMKKDHGEHGAVWDEVEMIYRTQYGEVDGKIDAYITYEYDDHGNVTMRKDRYRSSDEWVSNTYRYEWSYEDGLPASFQEQYVGIEGEPIALDITTEDGNVTEISFTSDDGKKRIQFYGAYDDEGRLTEEIRHRMTGDARYEYEYDDKGRLTQVTFSYRDGNYLDKDPTDLDQGWVVVRTVTYSYDQKGALTRIEHRDEYDVVGRTDYEYDSKGNILKKTLSSGDVYTYTYSDDGKTLECCEYTYTDSEGDIRVEEYEYDRHGNMISSPGYRYEYKEMKLSREDAARYYLQEHVEKELGADGYYRTYVFPYCYLIPTPPSPEYLNDPATAD